MVSAALTQEWQPLALATGTTLALAVSALCLGLMLAMLFTALECSRWRLVSWLASLWVMLLRGLPEILVVLFVYLGSSQLLMYLMNRFPALHLSGWNINPFVCGVIALSLLYAAYASQTLRGALKAIPVGQREAGQALGLGKSAIFFRVTMPQMWRHALPGLGNQWLVLLKDTALVSLISVNDLMLQIKGIITRTREPFTWYIAAALIYLLITLVSQYVLKRSELRATRFERKANS